MHRNLPSKPRRYWVPGKLARGAVTAAAALGLLGLGTIRTGTLPPQGSAYAQEAPVASGKPSPFLRLISQTQYVNAIRQVFGPDIEVRVRFAPVNRIDGLLGVGASTAVLTSGSMDPLEAVAQSVAEQVIDEQRRDILISCKPADRRSADPACARAFFAKAGRLLYRRNLTEAELADVALLATRAIGQDGDFYTGLAQGLAGMLVSPEFLFIKEQAEPDPGNPGTWRLDGYSRAGRLSFLLWNAPPDDALLAAAERGDLADGAGLQRQVDRMIGSPLYAEGVKAFFTDFFVLETFDTLAKDQSVYPSLTLKAVAEAREQLMRTVVDHLVSRRGDYRDLYTTPNTFMSSDLGAVYKVPVGLGSFGWVPHQFQPNDPRAGILTQVGFLAQHSPATRSSATRRGRAIREVLLCQHVPDPPPNVDFSKFEGPTVAKLTARERLTDHQENPICAGCHKVTDPIGLSLESFDGAGQFRTTEGGARIDASGSLDGVSFSDARGLAAALRDSPALKSCVVNRLYAYARGRKALASDEQAIEQYTGQLDRRGYRFDEMLRLMIYDKSFFAAGPRLLPAVTTSKTAYNGGSNAHQN